MSDTQRRERLLHALRDAVLDRYRVDPGPAGPREHARLARRRRDCRSLLRLGSPASETRGLARRLDAALQLGIGDDAPAQEALALELTALLVDLYGEFLAVGTPLRRG